MWSYFSSMHGEISWPPLKQNDNQKSPNLLTVDRNKLSPYMILLTAKWENEKHLKIRDPINHIFWSSFIIASLLLVAMPRKKNDMVTVLFRNWVTFEVKHIGIMCWNEIFLRGSPDYYPFQGYLSMSCCDMRWKQIDFESKTNIIVVLKS